MRRLWRYGCQAAGRAPPGFRGVSSSAVRPVSARRRNRASGFCRRACAVQSRPHSRRGSASRLRSAVRAGAFDPCFWFREHSIPSQNPASVPGCAAPADRRFPHLVSWCALRVLGMPVRGSAGARSSRLPALPLRDGSPDPLRRTCVAPDSLHNEAPRYDLHAGHRRLRTQCESGLEPTRPG